MQSLRKNKEYRTPTSYRRNVLRSLPRDTREACPIQRQCGGCTYVNEDYTKSLDSKVENETKKLIALGAVSESTKIRHIKSPRPLNYRTSVKLAVAPARPQAKTRGERFLIGLYQPGSHHVVEISRCAVQSTNINRLLVQLKNRLEQSDLQPYNETQSQGDLRYIAVRCNHLTDETMLTFVVTNPLVRPQLKAIVRQLQEAGLRISSAYLNINTQTGNSIFSYQPKDLVRLSGQRRLRTKMCGLTFEHGPTGFMQVNPLQAEAIYRRVEQLAGSGERFSRTAFDLYCGSGQIGSILAKSGFKVFACEENPTSIEDAKNNRSKNGFTSQQLMLLEGKVEEIIPQLKHHQPSLIVANPSRSGIDARAREVLSNLLINTPNARLIYVSCSTESLAQDRKTSKSEA